MLHRAQSVTVRRVPFARRLRMSEWQTVKCVHFTSLNSACLFLIVFVFTFHIGCDALIGYYACMTRVCVCVCVCV